MNPATAAGEDFVHVTTPAAGSAVDPSRSFAAVAAAPPPPSDPVPDASGTFPADSGPDSAASDRDVAGPAPDPSRTFAAVAAAPPPPTDPVPDPSGTSDADSDPDFVSSDRAVAGPEPDPSRTFAAVAAAPPPPDPADSGAVGSAEDPTASVESDERGFEARELPEELANSLARLECESTAEGGICQVYIVGTAHVSQDSCREVQEVIRCLRPEVVFLELCPGRVSILTPQNLKVPTVSEMIETWKKNKANTFGIVYSWFLAKVADNLDVFPGAEFRVGFEEARSYGAKVVLGDRPVNITLRRTWLKMSLWHRTKFIFCILFQSMFLPSPEEINKMMKEMDDVDMLTLVIQEMGKAFPSMMETLLHERDLYMSSTLLRVAREHSSVVAVVGKGHVSGMKKHWKQPIEMKDLLEIPTNEGISKKKVFASLGVAAAAVAAALYFAGKR